MIARHTVPGLAILGFVVVFGASALGLALAASSSAAGQPATPAPTKGKTAATAAAPPPAPAPPPEPPPPAYEPKLLRLSEILGTLAYMRDLCGAGDGNEWRKRMSALVAAEGDTPARKERLAGAFNRGYRGYEIIYRSCTGAAHVIIDRALDEGEKIAREIAARYAG